MGILVKKTGRKNWKLRYSVRLGGELIKPFDNDTKISKKIEVGKRIQLKRRCLHITQEELAGILNISLRHMAYIETGRRGLTLANAIAIADCLGLSLDYIYRGNTVSDVMDPLCQLVNDTSKHIQDVKDKEFYISQIISLSQHMEKQERLFEKVLETL